jgi:hypothetical protein
MPAGGIYIYSKKLEEKGRKVRKNDNDERWKENGK